MSISKELLLIMSVFMLIELHSYSSWELSTAHTISNFAIFIKKRLAFRRFIEIESDLAELASDWELLKEQNYPYLNLCEIGRQGNNNTSWSDISIPLANEYACIYFEKLKNCLRNFDCSKVKGPKWIIL